MCVCVRSCLCLCAWSVTARILRHGGCGAGPVRQGSDRCTSFFARILAHALPTIAKHHSESRLYWCGRWVQDVLVPSWRSNHLSPDRLFWATAGNPPMLCVCLCVCVCVCHLGLYERSGFTLHMARATSLMI